MTATPRLYYAQAAAEFRTPRWNPAWIHYRKDTNDWNTIYSSMSVDEYHVGKLTLEGTALDIGAYVGSVAIALALDNPKLKVICQEPVPENAEMIRLNIYANGLTDRVSVLHEASAAPGIDSVKVRWRFRGNTNAEHHAFVGNSTLMYDAAGEGLTYEEGIIPCRSIASIVEEYGPLCLVKIDSEGGEWSTLLDPAVKDLSIIVGEWHPIGGRTQDQFRALLEPSHDITFDGPEAGPGGFTAIKR